MKKITVFALACAALMSLTGCKKTKALAPEKIAGHFLKEFSKLINK